jgi:hypothetical protein
MRARSSMFPAATRAGLSPRADCGCAPELPAWSGLAGSNPAGSREAAVAMSEAPEDYTSGEGE